MSEDNLPNCIEKTNETILSEILACNECGKNYKITKAEFDFYKRLNIPIPHKDFECRHQGRMSKRNPRKLYGGHCMCTTESHINHQDSKCNEAFMTTYNPERKETVYCESCYQQVVS